LLTVLPHDRCRRFEPNADPAALVKEGTFSGNSPNNVLSRQNRCHYVANSGAKPSNEPFVRPNARFSPP
jgi:hypothetical protein